jgi:hypothetical protein
VPPIALLRELRLSLRLAIFLAAASILLAAGYLVFPGQSSNVVIPAFFVIQGFVSLWATQESFAASQGPRGCGVGVGLWLWLSLEFFVLAGIWSSSEGGPH